MEPLVFSRTAKGGVAQLEVLPGRGTVELRFSYIPQGETRPRRTITTKIADLDGFETVLDDEEVLVNNRVTLKDCPGVVTDRDVVERPGELRIRRDEDARVVQWIGYRLGPDDKAPRWIFRLSPLEKGRIIRLVRRCRVIGDIYELLEGFFNERGDG